MYPRTLGSNVYTGSKNSIGTTAVKLVSASLLTSGGVTVKASVVNSGRIYVGTRSTITANTNATTDGFELAAGESAWLPVNDAFNIYVIANTTAQKVFWLAP